MPVDPIELLRGAARGVTADVVGGPADIATMLTNLGIAGTGYGAHKLGLIDQPWDLLDPRDVPLSSDWFAKNTPLEGQGAEYDIGRILPALAGAGMSAVGGRINALRGPGAKQTGALYLDKQGNPGGEDFAMYHKTNLGDDTRLPRELSNPSFAVTHESKPLLDEFGPDILIPNPRQLEPRITPTRLHGSDAYTPRRHATFAEDELSLPRDVARGRLMDRDIPNMPGEKGNKRLIFGETVDMPNELRAFIEKPAAQGRSDTYLHVLDREPLYKSIEEYLRSPYGGGRIANKGGSRAAMREFRDWYTQKQFEWQKRAFLGGEDVNPNLLAKPEGEQLFMTDQLHNLPFMNVLRGGALDYYFNKPYAENQRQLVNSMFDEIARKAPSQYGEAKRYGPMGLNQDNFAAAIVNAGKTRDEVEALRNSHEMFRLRQTQRQLGKRGIQVYDGTGMSQDELYKLIQELQTHALRGTLNGLNEYHINRVE